MSRDPKVDILIEQAKRQCEGCRLAWRLDGWKHRNPHPIICEAQAIRQELRDIAAQLPWRKKVTVMNKVWIVEGEHHYVPGLVVKVCASPQLAALEAAALVNIVRNDLHNTPDATADNWEAKLEEVLVEHVDTFDEEPRVEISEHEIIGA